MARLFCREFNKVPIAIEGDEHLIKSIEKELSPLPQASGQAKLRIRISNKFLYPEKKSFMIYRGNYIGNNSAYLTLPFGKLKFYYKREPFTLDLYITNKNFLQKLIAVKFINSTYLSSTELSVYQIINGVIEPFFLFLGHKYGRTLLHASSLTCNSETLLLTGSGGVGKTSTYIRLIYDHGCKFLSDDISLVGNDGIVLYYPRYIMLYAYNCEEDETLYQRMMRGRSVIDRLHWSIHKQLRGNSIVRRRVPPSCLFNENKIERYGQLSVVIYLMKSISSTDFHLKEINAKELARKCRDIIELEYWYYIRYFKMLESTGMFPINIKEVLDNIENIYEKMFKFARRYILIIPDKFSYKEISNFIFNTILSKLPDN